MVTKINHKEWFPNLDGGIRDGIIPCFGTSRQAEEAAAAYGWGKRVIRIDRPLGHLYIVGVLDFQPREIYGVTVDILRVPLLRWETGEDGIKFNPVIEFTKPRIKGEGRE
jgi:hypothetical protein